MATSNDVLKKLSVAPKEVRYLNKSFVDFKGDLITFIKNYYPNTWTDFNEANPGMIMLELAAYVGDVLSFYVDNSFKENLLAYAEEEKNVITIAQAMGYKPKTIVPATAEVLVSQIVPAMDASNGYIPDPQYLLKLDRNSTFSTTGTNIVTFRSLEIVDFNDPTDRSIVPRTLDGSNLPVTYLVTKKVKVIAGEALQQTFTFGDPQKFSTITIGDTNVTTISNVTDADGNIWYEVEYLAQDTIIDDRAVSYTSGEGESTSPAYSIKYQSVPRRFISRLTADKKTQLVFGSGRGNVSEDIVYLDSQHVGNPEYSTRLASVSLSNTDLLNTDNFGLAPANTSITVQYFVGGGISTNVPSGTIVQVGQLNVLNRTTEFDASELALFNDIVATTTVFNEVPATGGQDGETVEEIRQRALATFTAQNRVVTRQDYEARVLAMPAKYGAIGKVYAISDSLQAQIQSLTTPTSGSDAEIRQYVEDSPKPNAINLYVLGYNQNGKLATLNTIVKQNLQQYLTQYRMLTDQVNILDAFVVNIGVNFDITVFKNYNMSDVLAICLGAVKDYFDNSKWQINQPIRLGDLQLLIQAQDGVQSVNNLQVYNKYFFKDGKDYQVYRYDIQEATKDNIIYPSLDPCIFEIRYPEDDIVGSARQ